MVRGKGTKLNTAGTSGRRCSLDAKLHKMDVKINTQTLCQQSAYLNDKEKNDTIQKRHTLIGEEVKVTEGDIIYIVN